MKKFKKLLSEYGPLVGTAGGSISAIFALWAWVGIATSGDLKRLDCKYAPAAVATFAGERSRLLATPPANTPENKAHWETSVKRTDAQLDDAIKFQISCQNKQ